MCLECSALVCLKALELFGSKLRIKYIQGRPLGFDIMYLARADKNKQVRFGLKVGWESLIGGI